MQGHETNVAYGDKCIGTNHTLPTLKAGRQPSLTLLPLSLIRVGGNRYLSCNSNPKPFKTLQSPSKPLKALKTLKL